MPTQHGPLRRCRHALDLAGVGQAARVGDRDVLDLNGGVLEAMQAADTLGGNLRQPQASR